MYILKVGMSYKTVPVKIREKFSLDDESLRDAITFLQAEDKVLENVWLSTCNRMEVYAVVSHKEDGFMAIKKCLNSIFETETHHIEPFLHCLEDEQAITHLYRVVVGLDAMVLGETQILGQVKGFFKMAQEMGATRVIFNELFKRAVTFAKKIHSQTEIGEHAVSVSYAAVELAKKVLGHMKGKHALIYGSGETGEKTLRNLQGAGIDEITVINRTYDKAERLAKKFLAKAKDNRDLYDVLHDIDILITSTSANNVIFDMDMMEKVQKEREFRPLFLIDIAVPRDIAANVASIENVFLYDIDDLTYIVDRNVGMRQKVAIGIEEAIEDEYQRFNDWIDMREVVPSISKLHKKARDIQEATLLSLERKLPDLDRHEREVIQKHMMSIASQLIKEPVEQVKKKATEDNHKYVLDMFNTFFGLDNEDSDKEKNNDEPVIHKMI